MSNLDEVILNCYECGAPIPCPRKLFVMGPKVNMIRSLKKDLGDGFTINISLQGTKPCCKDCSKTKVLNTLSAMIEKGIRFEEDEDWLDSFGPM